MLPPEAFFAGCLSSGPTAASKSAVMFAIMLSFNCVAAFLVMLPRASSEKVLFASVAKPSGRPNSDEALPRPVLKSNVSLAAAFSSKG